MIMTQPSHIELVTGERREKEMHCGNHGPMTTMPSFFGNSQKKSPSETRIRM